MKAKRIVLCIFLCVWAGMNTFFVFAERTQRIENLNASSATVYFNLETNTVTTADKSWTLSFNRTSIENNAGVMLQIVNQSFDQVVEAPKTGYLNALEKGSGNSWYVYDILWHSVTPLLNKTIVVKLASGNYVKVEIQNYYKDGNGESGFYTFRYESIK